MSYLTYVPYTVKEVALALGISDCDEILGEEIARDMLSGVVEFTPAELERLADYKDVDLEYIIEHDPSFGRYACPKSIAARKAGAASLVDEGHDSEFAAEFCGFDVSVVERLAVVKKRNFA